MKERIKQYYKDHEEAIVVSAATSVVYLGCVLLLRRTTSSQIRRVAEGGIVDSIEPLIRGDGVQVILAHARNGNTFRFEKNQ
jgi:hypothetical protein